jgi:hypothetical protein
MLIGQNTRDGRSIIIHCRARVPLSLKWVLPNAKIFAE